MTDWSGLTAIVIEGADHGLAGVLSDLGIRTLKADSAAQALNLCAQSCVDLAFADMLLPGGGETLLQALRQQYCVVRPGCALTCISGFPAKDAVFPVLTRPYSAESVRELIPQMLRQAVEIDDSLRRRIDGLLVRLGVPEHPGRIYLGCAVGMTMRDSRLSSLLSRRLYPMIAEQYDTKPAQVERAIRRCIDKAWSCGSIAEQYRLFGNTIDAQRGKPTIAQMIARCADILRLEEFL